MTKPVRGGGPAKPQATAKGRQASKGGRPQWKPNDEQRMLVTALSGRATQETIARMLGITVDTLAKHCRAELDAGVEDAYAHVESALFKQAVAGNVTAIVWYEKSRRRFREVQAHEHSGKDGGPIEYRDLTDEEVDARIAALLESGGAGEAST